MESLDQGTALVFTIKGMKGREAKHLRKRSFEQPRAKDPMSFDRTANGALRKLAEPSLHALHVLHGRPSLGFFSTNGCYAAPLVAAHEEVSREPPA